MMEIKEYFKQHKKLYKNYVEGMPIKPNVFIGADFNDKASCVYVDKKARDLHDVGIRTTTVPYTMVGFKDYISRLLYDHEFTGAMFQLPSPIPPSFLLGYITDDMDIDGMKKNSPFTPCTPKGIIDYLHFNNVKLEGMNAVVIGRSRIVGKPMANLLNREDCTVTLCHSNTKDISMYTKQADLIIVATGHRHTLTADMVENNPIVFDVGINVDGSGKLHGDCDYDDLVGKCKFISPVPGGVGLLTRVALIDNTIKSAERKITSSILTRNPNKTVRGWETQK